MLRISSLGETLARKGQGVHTISPDATVHAAVLALVEHRVGSLVVTRGDQVLGIVTERDILNDSARHHGESDTRLVERIMTREVICGEPGTSVEEGLRLMTEKRIRRLPVLEEGRLVGLVTIGDLVKAQLEVITDENKHLYRYVTDQYPG